MEMNAILMWISIKIEKFNRKTCGRLGRLQLLCTKAIKFHDVYGWNDAYISSSVAGHKMLLNFASQNKLFIKQSQLIQSIDPARRLINLFNLFNILSSTIAMRNASRPESLAPFSYAWFKSFCDKLQIYTRRSSPFF